jgi:hypothetical protein
MQGSFGPVSATSSITVSAPVAARSLTGVSLIPAAQVVATTGATAQFVAIGTYSSGSPATANLTNQALWQSSDTTIARVNATGLVTGVGVGQATISALATPPGGSTVAGTSTFTVTSAGVPRALTSLTVIPGSQAVTAAGETAQYIAIGTYNSGSPATADLTNQVSWRSTDVVVATINAAGLATAASLGQSTITALATASDGSAITAEGALIYSLPSAPAGPVSLPTLNIYNVGSGSGTVTDSNQVIDCMIGGGSATGCVGSFPVKQTIYLSATAAAGSRFEGWSLPCSPEPAFTPSCVIPDITNNVAVGAIFDLIAP